MLASTACSWIGLMRSHDWRMSRPSALEDIADFITQIADATRSRKPGFLLVGQNAEPLLASQRYLDAIDAVSKKRVC